jgi:hypothetical protein
MPLSSPDSRPSTSPSFLSTHAIATPTVRTEITFISSAASNNTALLRGAWDEINMTVTSMNLTTLLGLPVPPAGLTELENRVAAAVGAGAVLVQMAHTVSQPRNVAPPLAGGVFPNWYLGRATNVSFRVPRTVGSPTLSCAVVGGRWGTSTVVVNWTSGCVVTALPEVPASTTAAPTAPNSTTFALGSVSSVPTAEDDDWSRSSSRFNLTVGVSCGVAALVVLCSALFVGCVPSGSVPEATDEQADRQMRGDVHTGFKWNVYPQEKLENKEFVRSAKATKRRSTARIIREEPYPVLPATQRGHTSGSIPPPYRPPPPANGPH